MKGNHKRRNVAVGNELENRVGDASAVEGADGLVVDVEEVFVVENIEILWNEWETERERVEDAIGSE